MEKINELLKPMDSFERALRAHEQNVKDLFESLARQSNVDTHANKKTCDSIYSKQKSRDKQDKHKKGAKVGKGFSIAGAVIGFIIMVVGILIMTVFNKNGDKMIPIILTAVGAAVGIGLTLLICLVINKSIKKSNQIISKLEDEIKHLTDEAWEQMRPLNSLWTWNMPQYLINEMFAPEAKADKPLIYLDRAFTPKRYFNLVEKYDLNEKLFDDDESVIAVQSGEIRGNPFVFIKTMNTWMGSQTYTGTRLVTWVTYERDSNGNTRAVHHSQTLVATVTKPKPEYGNDVQLIYGNDAAPNLDFGRAPSNIKAGEISDKKLAKIVKKTGKKLDKKTRKAMTDGNPDTNYVKMENNEFETLFNCTDRSNEREFRLLFTPVAQINFCELFKKSPYGDDFIFRKVGKLNQIRSGHTKQFDFHAAPWLFEGFDYEKTHQFFVNYCCQYFQSVYFDLAPLLSIPMYQNMEANDYGFKPGNYYNTTFHEVESLCNYYGAENFCHPSTATDTILKCSYNKKDGAIDSVTIHAYSYRSVQHTSYIPRVAGDGRTYDVPVVWYEYIPVSKDTHLKAFDFQGYNENSKDKKADIYKDYKVASIYGQKGLALSH